MPRRSTARRQPRTAQIHTDIDKTTPVEPLAKELHEALTGAKSPLLRAAIASAEARLLYRLGQTDRVRELGLAAAQASPRFQPAWTMLTTPSYGKPGYLSAVCAASVWVPDNPDTWNSIGYSIDNREAEAQLAFQRRSGG